MYLKHITLENIGPIENLDFDLPINESSHPKPLILVGENGAGKSILLSYVVNSLINIRQTIGIENLEVESGKAYKLRSPLYIQEGKEYSYSCIKFHELFPPLGPKPRLLSSRL